jgi:hypothetical protein
MVGDVQRHSHFRQVAGIILAPGLVCFAVGSGRAEVTLVDQ